MPLLACVCASDCVCDYVRECVYAWVCVLLVHSDQYKHFRAWLHVEGKSCVALQQGHALLDSVSACLYFCIFVVILCIIVCLCA